MNFDFSEQSSMLRDQARRYLAERCGTAAARQILEGKPSPVRELWNELAAMGWLGTAIPEEYGGSGMGYEALCVLAEELGRVLAPMPFGSSLYLAAEAIFSTGSENQKSAFLPGLADGSRIGTLAWCHGVGRPSPDIVKAQVIDGQLSGDFWPVPDGLIADIAVVVARDDYGIGLFHVDLIQDGVERRPVGSFDLSREQARLIFRGAKAERMGATEDAWHLFEKVLHRAAILVAFEQLGGAEACLFMARDYAMDRRAFGRPIASMQAIKHKLADVYVEIELARSNAYYGALALSENESQLPLAAAAARVSAIEAFRLAATENIQTHGGVGFTWEYDPHLYYRRAQVLALGLGGAPFWKDQLMDHLPRPQAI